MVEILLVPVEKEEQQNVILGQAHFIKTVEDLHEAIVNSNYNIRFGLAFNEASGPRLIRFSGNDDRLIELAKKNAMNIGAGHFFIIVMEEGYPINVLNAVKNVPEVAHIYAAGANPMQVIVAKTDMGNAVLGVVDGFSPLGFEDEEAVKDRKDLLRKIGYKL